MGYSPWGCKESDRLSDKQTEIGLPWQSSRRKAQNRNYSGLQGIPVQILSLPGDTPSCSCRLRTADSPGSTIRRTGYQFHQCCVISAKVLALSEPPHPDTEALKHPLVALLPGMFGLNQMEKRQDARHPRPSGGNLDKTSGRRGRRPRPG